MLVLITYRTEKGLNVGDMTRYLIGSEHIALSCVWQSGAKTPKRHLHWMLGPVDVNEGTERCVFECIHPMWGVFAGSTLERHSTRIDLCSGCSITFFSSLPPLSRRIGFLRLWLSGGPRSSYELQRHIWLSGWDCVIWLKALWPPTSSWEKWHVPMLCSTTQPLKEQFTQK